jgi:adenosylhomocysteine nucleosidase
MSGIESGGAVAILTALPEESRPILSRMAEARPAAAGGLRAWEGRLAGRMVLLAETGAGERAAAAAAGLFERRRPDRWIGAGFAGALSPGLPVGSVVVASEVAGGTALDAGMARRALDSGGEARAVRAAFSPRIVGSPSEKARLLEGIGIGGTLPVTVDMESAAWARAAAGIPGVLVRVVSDAAEDEIPAFVGASVDAEGAIDRGRLVRHALLHPASIGKLLDLRRRARTCGERLAVFLERFAARGF